jgi:hypothetical protein
MTTQTTTTPPINTEAGVIAKSQDWQEAVRDLIEYRVVNGLCFSSGEIAAVLRTHRMADLRFSVLRLGEYVRDLFYAGLMPQYAVEDDNGDVEEVSPLQVSRYTKGIGRTPAGQEVFVYGPTQEACDDHDFEVDIPIPPGVKPAPLPGGTAMQHQGQTAHLGAPAPSGYPTQIAAAVNPVPAQAAVKAAQATLTVKVISDCRCVVYRNVFEAWVHYAKKTMRAGAPVYIRFENDKAFVSLDDPPQGDAAIHQLHTGSRPGRVFFASPKAPFTPGDEYGIELTDDALVVDLSKTV